MKESRQKRSNSKEYAYLRSEPHRTVNSTKPTVFTSLQSLQQKRLCRAKW